ncbi:MAG: PDZ domain-containing protein [Candidatus Brocadiae bacterium]|nr:PDZ domain-containing protein [Candidatus Brocadiia bacterium]
MTRRSSVLICALAALVVVGSVPSACLAAGPPVDQQVGAIVAKLRQPTASEIWTAHRQLHQLGAPAVAAIKGRLPKALPAQQLVLAKALCSLGHAADAVGPLVALIRSKEARDYAALAAQLLGEPPANDLQVTEDALMRLVDDQSLLPDVRRAVARSLGLSASTLESVQKANATLRKLLGAATDPDTRRACALALAEIDDFAPPVDAILKELQDEPSNRGRLARALLQVNTLRTLLIRPQGRERQGLNDRLLNEVRTLMQRFHVEVPLSTTQLVNSAAKGMAAAVRANDDTERQPDRHTAYFDEDDWKRFRESLSGRYGGIGAVVQFTKHFDTGDVPVFTIARPNYSGPAYQAGLRSFDRIVAVDGQATAIEKAEDAQAKLKAIVDTLRGRPGTPVELTVTRPGSKERRQVKVERADIELPSVRRAMLPAKIGYVRLANFGQKSAAELEEALRALEKEGMRALIFDLRNNPGGQLNISVEIADKLLKDNKLIVYTEGRNPKIAKREEYRTKDPTTHPDYPVVVLINGHSASASEIVAGALQEHHRAILVGTTTFGKGSVQKLFPLHATAGRSGLKLTVAKYYLPSGRSIHGKGVEPDVKVKFEGTFTRDEFEKLRENGAFYRYSATRFAQHKELLAKLSEFDALDPSRYPDFEGWHKGMAGELGRDKARRLLRAWLRLLVADDRGEEFVCDVEEDNQLQAAILEIARRVEAIEPKRVPEYRFFAPKDAAAPPAKKATAPPAKKADTP